MDLEFMVLDILDKFRPSKLFIKYDDCGQANNACIKIEEYEAAHYKVGVLANGESGSLNLMSERDHDLWVSLISSLVYAEDKKVHTKKSKG